jgi:RNA polymerase sigma factor (sigma-70 family)
MTSAAMTGVLHYLRALARTKDGDEQPDGELLRQFVARHDEGAFATLLERHGPMVLGVCRQVLGDTHDAEDSFQATFLVLARRAASIRSRESLAAWLQRVAVNLARTARLSASRRRTHERRAVLMAHPTAANREALPDWRPILHEEVARLPEKYRVPVVLCYLEGRTHGEAARQLGWPVGTVKGRLARARALLRTRLARRGLALSVGGLAAVWTERVAGGQVSASLLAHTLRAALSFARTGTIPAGTVTSQGVALAKGALPTMTATKLVSVFVLLATIGLAGFAAALGPGLEREAGPEARAADAAAAPAPRGQADTKSKAIAAHGDPLPAGALARFGTVRFRHGGTVASVAYLGRGNIVASAGSIGRTAKDDAHGTIRLWEAETGKELRQFQLRGMAHAAVSPDGKLLAGGGSFDGALFLCDAATGEELRRLQGSRGWGGNLSLAFSPDGRTLAAGANDLRLWDVATGKLLHSEHVGEPVFQVAFSLDGKTLGVSCVDQLSLRLFEVDGWKERFAFPAKHGIRVFAFSPDQKTLAAEGGREISLYESATGKRLRQFAGHQEEIHALVFSEDGKSLASAAADKTIRLWEVATGKERRAWSVASPASALAFGPGGKTLASAHDGVIRIWDLATGKALPPDEGHQGGVSSVALSADGKTLISASTDATIRIWETSTGKELRRIQGHEGSISSLSLSPDRKLLASVCTDDQTVRLWDLPTGKQVNLFPASSYRTQAAWLPDGKTLIVGPHDRTLHFYDITTGRERHTIEGAYSGAVLVVAPDGTFLATGNLSRPTFHLRATATGKALPALPADSVHDGPVTSAAFSPDGKTLITGSSSDRVIRHWELSTGKERLQFLGHEEEITCLALSPDGRTLASGSYDRTIRLWEVSTGEERRRFVGHRGTVTALAWSADAKVLASGSADDTALAWDLAGR